jgi:hypothetical protein
MVASGRFVQKLNHTGGRHLCGHNLEDELLCIVRALWGSVFVLIRMPDPAWCKAPHREHYCRWFIAMVATRESDKCLGKRCDCDCLEDTTDAGESDEVSRDGQVGGD